MFRRLLRSVIVLAALLGAYQAYVTFAVPRMEPSLAVREQRRANRDELDNGAKAVTKYQLLLSNYFPKDHWSQVRPPKVFANGTEKAMLVIDEYTRHQEGGDNDRSTQVDIKRFAMLMFPTPPHEGVTAPRDAIILEAPQGARLIFDDFHPELGKIGQITRGEFPGPITIRSDMHEPGPDDDLLVETSDLQMNTKLLYTASPVRFRLGQNFGSGRELEIRFLADEHVQPRESGLKIAGFDTLEIRRDVRMRMQLNTASLLGGDKQEATAEPPAVSNPSVQVSDAQTAAAAPPKPPVDVTCNGPFTFDFVRYVASVDRDVEVRQLNPDGPCDQLTCNQLDIHFAAKALSDAKTEPVVVDPGKRQHRDLGRLEPVAIVAQGHPAIAVSPARKAEARGDRIQIALHEQRLRIDGGSDAMLTNGPNVLRAPVIDYQQPERDSASQIGRFRATGPGSLHFVADPAKPDQVFQAAWHTSVQLGREKGQPVIVMEGRPELAFAAAGSMIADQIRLYLRELDGNSAAGLPLAGGNGDKQKQSRLAPDRLIAVGRVEIASPQLTGRTQQLIANFRIQPEAANSGKTAPNGPAGRSNTGPNDRQPQQAYQVVAEQMRLDVFLRGQTAVPATLACEGNVALREAPQAGAEQQPLEIHGGQLTVEQLDTPAPHVILKGIGPSGPVGSLVSTGGAGGNHLAKVSGRGVTLLTDAFEMDGGGNRMWSDGPGEATLIMSRDLQGNASATPTPVNIHWKGGLRFDGQSITFDREVVVAETDSTLHCDRMLAKLAAPIQIGQRIDQTATNVSQIDCEGQVTIENVSRNTEGVTSHDRMQLGRLSINQQTGAISGQGPGVIRSTRYGGGLGSLAGPSAGQPQIAVPPPGASGSKLYFLRVDFHTGMDGNMYTRELTFHGRVRAVYGPVDSWEQELDLTRPESLPPESMTLTCDDLRLNEDPLAARSSANPTPNTPGGKQMGPLQLQAKGDVRIQGATLSQGEFRIQADRASYDRQKDAFTLEGDTRTPARLWRRAQAGADASPFEARTIYYSRSTNVARATGFQNLEIGPEDLDKVRRPASK